MLASEAAFAEGAGGVEDGDGDFVVEAPAGVRDGGEAEGAGAVEAVALGVAAARVRGERDVAHGWGRVLAGERVGWGD